MPRNEKKSGDMPEDNGVSKDFTELLQLYQKIPEAGRKKLIKRVKREAAGDILTDEMIEKEKKSLRRFFSKIDDPRKKNLIFRKIDEIAFQFVAMEQAKESMITEGLNSKVVNGKQSYDKEDPAVAIYDKYSRAYNANIDKLIEYLPPQEKKKISRLAALREG